MLEKVSPIEDLIEELPYLFEKVRQKSAPRTLLSRSVPHFLSFRVVSGTLFRTSSRNPRTGIPEYTYIIYKYTRYIGVLLLIESCWAKTADWRPADGSYSSTRFPDKCISKLNIISIPPDAQQLYT